MFGFSFTYGRPRSCDYSEINRFNFLATTETFGNLKRSDFLHKCTYCGEDQTILISKPAFFIYFHNEQQKAMLNIDEGKLVCFPCLEYELNEIKEIE